MNGTAILAKPRRWMRQLYDWTLHWSTTPYASAALFVIAFAESSFFPIPPDVLLIAMTVALPKRFFRYAWICSLGSVVGGVFGYYIGWALMETMGWRIIDFYQAHSYWDKVRTIYQEWGVWFLAIAAFTPVPYKVATIAAGATQMAFLPFVIVSFLGRAGRFFLVAGILRIFGEPMKQFIEKYFDLLSIIFTVLLIGGFVAVKFLVR